MSNYTQVVNFTAKDTLSVGDPMKIVRGSDFDGEFGDISDAVITKVEGDNGDHTGVTTIQAITLSGAFTGTLDGGSYT